jgi:hypothetical protein
MILKDTKTHQMRRVSIDEPTVELLRKHKDDCTHRMFLLGLPLTDDTWLFSAQPDLTSRGTPAQSRAATADSRASSASIPSSSSFATTQQPSCSPQESTCAR